MLDEHSKLLDHVGIALESLKAATKQCENAERKIRQSRTAKTFNIDRRLRLSQLIRTVIVAHGELNKMKISSSASRMILESELDDLVKSNGRGW